MAENSNASASTEKNVAPPPGLKALIEHFQSIYPEQRNPLQVSTVLKYWLGGNDPLDYISMYNNKGNQDLGVPPHWHYVSFGLSDLHGDGRVHVVEKDNQFNTASGMGFELTFRLLKTPKEMQEQNEQQQRPPTWPANLLQSIARYCFQTGNTLCVGDNIPWKRSLDGSNDVNKIRNILIAHDPQLGCLETPFGTVDFCQIVGVTGEELEQAARWNGRGVLNYLRQDSYTGGAYLVTNMERSLSVFELLPDTLMSLEDDLEKQGSDLAGVNADFDFREIRQDKDIKEQMDSCRLSDMAMSFENNRSLVESEIKREENDTTFPQSMSMSSNSLHNSCPLNFQPPAPACLTLDGLEITLAPSAANYLLLAIKDRIRHGRHFTFKGLSQALTLVAESVTGTVVNKDAPYAVLGYWIQVLIPEDLVPRMMADFRNAELDGKGEIKQRLEFEWPDKRLKIIVDQPIVLNL